MRCYRRRTWEDLPKIPITPKEHLSDRPNDFVCESAKVAFRTTTHSTTGLPTNLCFSQREMKSFAYLCAISNAMIGDFLPDDIVLSVTASRALLGNLTAIGCIVMLDSTQMNLGQVDPSHILDLLVEEHHLPGKRAKVSVLVAYPSYLGKLVEEGLRRGLTPDDFGLRRIDTGGEIVTDGLKRRAQELLGPIGLFESYGSTETWGTGGGYCSQGHLHFGSGGIWEFLDPDSFKPAGEGEVATLVPHSQVNHGGEARVSPGVYYGYFVLVTGTGRGGRHRERRPADGGGPRPDQRVLIAPWPRRASEHYSCSRAL